MSNYRDNGRNGISEAEYYNWLLGNITDADFNPSNYSTLMRLLYNTEFTWVIEEDENRAQDGIDLRVRYAEEMGYSHMEALYILNRPCSVLEMMIALACRTENQIMEDLFVGPRFGRWFKVMIASLGLRYETDDYFDENYVDYIIQSFLKREYEEDGDGGLFRIRDHHVDMRREEIWTQMNWYLRELLQVG